ncbi:MAG: SIMPL domain-containing protein [Rubellimicrobium sp.]|nr:SIMPL domain-containing protein [Rubellimicrobium sp.]
MALAVPALALADGPARTITVTGTGEVARAPDMATISLGVRHEAATAREALDLMSAAMTPVLERLAAAGIAPADMQTGSLGLDPVFEYPENHAPRVTGYTAWTGLSVRVRDLAQVGAILDAVVSDGANSLDGIAFGLADPAAALAEARIAAVADARARAELYAGAAGVELGGVLSIGEGGSSLPGPAMYDMRAMSAAVPVAAGEVQVSAQVTVVYAID